MKQSRSEKTNEIRLRPADIVLIIILIAVSIGGFNIQKGNNNKGRFFIVEVDGKTLYRLSLLSDTLISIQAKTGKISLKVEDSRVSVHKSSCPLKICVKTGWIARPGESIICVPNKLVIRIEGVKNAKVDAVTQ